MAEVTSELIYELMNRMHNDLSNVKEGLRELRRDNLSIRNQLHSMQGDINNLRASMGHMETRLERIENRLDLRELAEKQHSFDLNS